MKLKEKLRNLRSSHEYKVEKVKLEFISCINKMMISKNITNADLARKIGSSPAYVTKIMKGDCNFTIDSMVKITDSLGARMHIHVADSAKQIRWIEAIEGVQQVDNLINSGRLKKINPKFLWKEVENEGRRLCA